MRTGAQRLFQTFTRVTPTRAAVLTGAGCFAVAAMTQQSEMTSPSLYDLILRLEERLKKVEADTQANSNQYSVFRLLDKLYKAKDSNPNNLSLKHFCLDYFESLSPQLKERFLKTIKSGIENPDSSVGVYAMYPDDYEVFKPFMDKVIREYHKISGDVHHVTNWDLSTVKGLPAGQKLDLTALGLGETSMRVRVGRNLANFPLPGAMSKCDRVRLESDMIGAFEKLIADPAYGGNYYSLTPGTRYSISNEQYEKLVDDHVMFKNMADDPYLQSAGISSHWPHGRGCYVSKDRGFIIWVGEEDHLRIMCMKKGVMLNDVFDRLREACGVVENVAGKFAHSPSYGYVTSCPTNLGTGMRASIHIALPKLTKNGKDVSEAKTVCKALGLSVRGIGGEHTEAGAGGIVDISPSARLQIQEAEIICALYQGISQLMGKENKL